MFPKSRIFGRYHLRYLDPDTAHCVDVLSGAFMLLRRDALKQTGLLDERFFMYGEDIDLSYRVAKSGMEVWYLPYRIMHYKGESAHSSDARYVRLFFVLWCSSTVSISTEIFSDCCSFAWGCW